MTNKKMAEFMVMSVNDFARENNISVKDSFAYLSKYKGLDYLQEFYGVEHTLSPADTVEALAIICERNGGDLQLRDANKEYLKLFVSRGVITYIAEDAGVDIKTAMEIFYSSAIFDKLQDSETGLYKESASYVYELFKTYQPN